MRDVVGRILESWHQSSAIALADRSSGFRFPGRKVSEKSPTRVDPTSSSAIEVPPKFVNKFSSSKQPVISMIGCPRLLTVLMRTKLFNGGLVRCLSC